METADKHPVLSEIQAPCSAFHRPVPITLPSPGVIPEAGAVGLASARSSGSNPSSAPSVGEAWVLSLRALSPSLTPEE